MSLRLSATLRCDRCAAELRGLPAAGGLHVARWVHHWRRYRAPHGTIDLCPACGDAAERERLEASLRERRAAVVVEEIAPAQLPEGRKP